MSRAASKTGLLAAATSFVDTIIQPPPEGATLKSKLVATPLHTWLLLAGLVFSMFAGYTRLMGFPIAPDRLLIPAAIVLALMSPSGPRQRMTASHWLAIVFILWGALDILLRGFTGDSYLVISFLDRAIIPLLLFFLAPVFFDTAFRRRLLLVTVTGIALYLGFTAVAEMYVPQLVLPRYITNPDIGLHLTRARGPFLSADAMGTACGIVAPTGVILATRNHGTARAIGVAAGVLALSGVLLSLTRAAWLAVAVALLVAIALVPILRRYLPHLLALCVGVAGLVYVFVPSLAEQITDRSGSKEPLWDRLGSNDAALALLRDRPLTGVGWRRFYPDGAEWFRQSDAYPTNAVVIEVHNVVLARFAELGMIAGTVFVLLLILGPGRHLWTHFPTARRYGAIDAVAHSTMPRTEAEDWRLMGALAITVWLVSGMFGPMAVPFPTFVAFLICGVGAGAYLTDQPPLNLPLPDEATQNRRRRQ